MPRYELIAGLDIGAAKVSLALVRREYGSDHMQFAGCFSVACDGLSSSGSVLDLTKLADAVAVVLEKSQEAVKQNISTAFVNISGTHISAENVRGRSNLLSKENEISRKDLDSVYRNAKVSAISYDREPVLVVPQDYIVDGQRAIKNPVGLFGSRLDIDYLFVTGSTPAIGNLCKAVNMGGLEIEEIVLSNLASSFSALTASEKDLGVVLVDIGDAVTEVSVFTDSVIRYDKMLAFGSADLAAVICEEFKIQRDIALKIIKNYCKLDFSGYSNPEEKILIKEISPPRAITQGQLQKIIESNIKGILGKIKETMQLSEYVSGASCGIVLIGGISSMDGLAEMAEPAFNMPVRVGFPKGINTTDHSNITALGLAIYGFQKRNSNGLRRQLSENVLKRAFQATKDFIYDYF